MKPNVFTLIELLVVVTIIVVLLALLAPALETAIYQAELAVCAAQQAGAAGGVTRYAMDNRRWYPDRKVPWSAETLKTPVNWPPLNNTQDDRPLMRGFMSPNLLVCPPAGKVDLNDEHDPNPEGSFVIASMTMWWDWQYTRSGDARCGRGMNRVGDRWEWDGLAFSWLLTDLVDVDMSTDAANRDNKSSHPDADGAFTNHVTQFGNTVFAIGPYNIKATWAAWFGMTGSYRRGAVVANSAASDGSATRYTYPALRAGYFKGMLDNAGFADVPVFRNLDRYDNNEQEHNLVPIR